MTAAQKTKALQTDLTATKNGSTPSPRLLLLQLRAEVNQYVFEREDVIDGILAALLARKHVVQIGPKGCAKSFTCDLIASALDVNYFSTLLHSQTSPEELFGPISISELKTNDILKRNIDGRLPWAHLANLEEIFNAPTMLFGALHRIANERKYGNPDEQDCPLFSIIGSANKLPNLEHAEAFFDRILLRYPIDYLQDPVNKKKLMLGHGKPVIQTKISLAALQAMHTEVDQVQVPEIIAEALLNLETQLAQESIFISDRRRNDLIDLLKAYAYLLGEDVVSDEHFSILPFCLWEDLKQLPTIKSIVTKMSNPVVSRTAEILESAKALVRDLGDLPANADETTENEWQVNASGVSRQMKTLLTDLNLLITENPSASVTTVRKVNDAIQKVEEMKNTLVSRLTQLLQQSA